MKKTFHNSSRRVLILAALLFCAAVFARTIGKDGYFAPEFPPQRPDPVPVFTMPREGQTLDDGWSYVQTLYDADTTNPNYPTYLNAVPVGMEFTKYGRGFIAMLHTVFRTVNGGHTWTNLDFNPPPRTGGVWASLRSPTFINDLSVRPVLRSSAQYDTLVLSTLNSGNDLGTLRVVYYFQSHVLYPLSVFSVPYWLTNIEIMDSVNACALAGLNGKVYATDSLWLASQWEELNPTKVIIRAGREDSATFADTWISSITSCERMYIAVGSHQWISRDRGLHWQIKPASDALYDNAVDFADTVYGMTAGGSTSPEMRGWLHRTTDGARTWSDRQLDIALPLRTVLMVSRDIAFAAGGDLSSGTGEIWATTNGGQSWSRDLTTTADIRALSMSRVNAAYVDVFAAGAFPDFRGGVWRKRILQPLETGPVLISDPDTLDFGELPASISDTMTITLRNIGTETETVYYMQFDTALSHDENQFHIPNGDSSLFIGVGEEADVNVVFRSDSLGSFSALLKAHTAESGDLEIFCTANVPLNSKPREEALLPGALRMTIWPNPGNASFEIRFELARAAVARMCVFDLAGRLVETLTQASFTPGEYALTWNAANHATGIYFVRLDVEGSAGITQKVLLVK